MDPYHRKLMEDLIECVDDGRNSYTCLCRRAMNGWYLGEAVVDPTEKHKQREAETKSREADLGMRWTDHDKLSNAQVTIIRLLLQRVQALQRASLGSSDKAGRIIDSVNQATYDGMCEDLREGGEEYGPNVKRLMRLMLNIEEPDLTDLNLYRRVYDETPKTKHS